VNTVVGNTTTVTPVNTVGGDANLDAVKKTAESGVATNSTIESPTNKQQQPSGTSEVDSSEFS
jgi:hypothetical protein